LRGGSKRPRPWQRLIDDRDLQERKGEGPGIDDGRASWAAGDAGVLDMATVRLRGFVRRRRAMPEQVERGAGDLKSSKEAGGA